MKTKTILFIRFAAFFAALAIMVLIFLMSAQNNEQSGSASAGIIDALARFLNPKYSQLSSDGQAEYIEGFQFLLRKGAHFSLYAALCSTLSVAFLTFRSWKRGWRFLSAFVISALYSVSDEIHQLFVPGRSGEVRDVLIDSVGAAVGCLIIYLFYHIYKKQKSSRK